MPRLRSVTAAQQYVALRVRLLEGQLQPLAQREAELTAAYLGAAQRFSAASQRLSRFSPPAPAGATGDKEACWLANSPWVSAFEVNGPDVSIVLRPIGEMADSCLTLTFRPASSPPEWALSAAPGGAWLLAAETALRQPVLNALLCQLLAAGEWDVAAACVLAVAARHSGQPQPVEHYRARLARLRQAFLQALGARPQPTADELACEEELRRAANQQRSAAQELAQLAARREALRQATLDAAALADEYDRLCRLPLVKSVTPLSYGVQVDTHPIQLRDEAGVWREIGCFRMELNFFQAGISLRNLTHPMEHIDHPHVNNGAPCLGDLSAWLSRALAAGQADVIVAQLLEFLLSYNDSSRFRPASCWPLAAGS